MPPGTRILIVDDEQTLAENLWAYFRRRLAVVKVVASGEAAIEVAGEFRPDVLILDYGLPGMDGLETYRRLKALPLRYGCVLVTGEAAQAVPEAARTSGIRHVLEKPFSLSELEKLIARQLIAPVHGGGGERRAVERRGNPGADIGPLRAPYGRPAGERRRTERRSAPDRRTTR